MSGTNVIIAGMAGASERVGEGQRRNGKQILDERGWSVTLSDGIVAAAAAPEFQQLQKCVTGVCA